MFDDNVSNGSSLTIYAGPQNQDRIPWPNDLPYPDGTAEEVFPEFTATLRFWMPGDKPVQNSLKITQKHYDVYADLPMGQQFVMDGSEYSFRVRSNTSWEVFLSGSSIIENYVEILTPTGGNHPDEDGEFFRFKVNEDLRNIGGLGGAFTFVAKDPLHDSDARRLYAFTLVSPPQESDVIEGGEANCYMLHPNGDAIKIPVSQANRGIPNQIANGETLNYKLIWTDHPDGISDVGVISKVEVDGTGPDANLIVYPGTAEGNAVVAVTNASRSVVYWSWHLWVSDFDPNDNSNDFYKLSVYEFLDRNLGALSEDPTDYRSQGLFYQWGRKDPFPYANAIGSTSFIPIYDEEGNQISMSIQAANSGIMLEHSVRNPLDFITSSDADWYSTNYSNATSAERQAMWHPGATYADIEKSIYDPCPDGWRVVPGDNGGNSLWYSVFSARTAYPGYSEVNGTISIEEYVDLGIWPHAGYLDGTTNGRGALTSGGKDGYYWTANSNGAWSTSSLYVGLMAATVELSNDRQRRHALSVRCMRRTED